MKKLTLSIFIFVFFSVSVYTPIVAAVDKNSNQELLERAKKAAAYDLADPNAAQFRSVFVSNDIPTYVCGEINAKNKFGAYTGFNLFSYDDKTGKVKILNPDATYYKVDLTMHGIYCKPNK